MPRPHQPFDGPGAAPRWMSFCLEHPDLAALVLCRALGKAPLITGLVRATFTRPNPRPRTLPPTIPKRLLMDKDITAAVANQYATLLPEVTKQATLAVTPAALDDAYEAWLQSLRLPWLHYCRPTMTHRRPGRTRAISALQRERDKLVTAAVRGNSEARLQARLLDKEVKRRLRARRRYLATRQHPPDHPSSLLGGQAITMAREALAQSMLDEIPICRAQFVHNIQKSLREDPALPAQKFQVPGDFKTDVRMALMTANRDKASGPDAIPMRMIACAPDEAIDFITALWTAVGRLGHLPAPLSDSTIVPVWKQEGNRRDISTYRPITLLTTTRRIISAAVDVRLRREVQFDKHQWSFRHGTGTEHALAFLARQRRKGHRVEVLLDLKAAYDRALRKAIADIGKERLHPTLAGMVQTLLSPGRIAARNAPLTGGTVSAGVPQGDPISPSLFNLLMDTLLSRARSDVNHDDGNASCFADDVMIMSKSRGHAQRLLDICTAWALEFKMQCSVRKCAHLCHADQLPPAPALSLSGDTLPGSNLVRYLGVDLDCNGVHASSVDRRIPKALNCLRILRSSPQLYCLPFSARRQVVRTFVLPCVDYALPLSPCSAQTLSTAASLDKAICTCILAVPVPPASLARARALTRLPSIRARRIARAARLMQSTLFSTAPDEFAEWRSTLIAHDPTIQGGLSPYLDAIRDPGDSFKCELYSMEWAQANVGRRPIPSDARTLPLMTQTDQTTQRRAALYYLNSLPSPEWLTIPEPQRKSLRTFLSSNRLSKPQITLATSIFSLMRRNS